MFKKNNFKKCSTAVFATTILTSAPQLASANYYYQDYNVKYEITIQNITDSLIFTPFVVEGAKRKFKLFVLGEPATPGLKEQARSGSTMLLKEELATNPKVCDVEMTDQPLIPGEKISVTLEMSSRCHYLSLSAMFLPSNDGFAGLTHKWLPHYGTKTYFARAYDAGAEFNSGSCVDKPGPQCQGTGLEDASDFKKDLLDFVRPFAPYTVEIVNRASKLNFTDNIAVAAATKDGFILGRAQFGNPIVKVTAKVIY